MRYSCRSARSRGGTRTPGGSGSQPGTRPPGLLLGVGSEGHLHDPTLEPAVAALDGGDVLEAFGDLLEDALSVLGPAHLAAAEADGDADVFALLEEATSVADLEVQVVIVRLGTELHFLELVGVLLLLGFLGGLLLFVLVLAPIHDADDWGACAGSDLDQVELSLRGAFPGVVEGDDADLLSLGVDQPDGADANVVVYAGLGPCYEILRV